MMIAEQITKKELNDTIVELNRIVTAHSQGSAARGLEILTAAFAALLDCYALPNEQNPEGMCSDPVAFRKHFALNLTEYPPLQKKGKRGK
jgi:hypothetical protein